MDGEVPSLRLSRLGHNPHDRHPWGSAVFVVDGCGVTDGNVLRQYFFDCDGYPVLTHDGRPVHVSFHADGSVARDADGYPILTPVPIPTGASVTRRRPLKT